MKCQKENKKEGSIAHTIDLEISEIIYQTSILQPVVSKQGNIQRKGRCSRPMWYVFRQLISLSVLRVIIGIFISTSKQQKCVDFMILQVGVYLLEKSPDYIKSRILKKSRRTCVHQRYKVLEEYAFYQLTVFFCVSIFHWFATCFIPCRFSLSINDLVISESTHIISQLFFVKSEQSCKLHYKQSPL